MNATRAGTHRTSLARLVFLAGLLLAFLLAFGGQPFRLGRSRPIASAGGQGYWLVAKDGGVFGYGDAVHRGANLNSGNDVIGIAATPTMQGYWTVDDDGTVFSYGDAHDYGSRVSTVDDVRGFAARPQGDGYWLVTRDGVVTPKGAAASFGNAPALAATQKIVGMASSPSGNGYWLVGRDGGIFAFGDAGFYGSTGAITLNQPIVGMARSASGHGYRFVASDGGVFSFGDAAFYGSAGANPPPSGVTAIAPTVSGNGYWLVAGNGKVFPFGDAVNYGDASTLTLRQPIIGIAATPLLHVNFVPAPVADSASVAEDASGSINVLANDAGLDDGPIAVAIVSGPAHGSASVAGDKKINYSPSANYNGSDSITYKVTDTDGESATAVLSLTVTAVNDAPSVVNGSLNTSEDTAAGGTFSGSDIDGNALTYSVVAAPAHGSVVVSGSSYTYTPATNYNGADSFTFRANDGSVNSNTGTVSVTVTPVADTPLASNASVSTDEDAPLSGSLSGFDGDGDTLAFAVTAQPANGQLTVVDGEYTYTPDADFNGTDSFSYTASDGTLTSAPATVTITVTAVNDSPAADAATATTDEDTVLIGPLAGSDIDEDALTFSVSTNPQHGTVTIEGDGYTYTPAANYHGPDSFAFVANDGTVDSAPATVALTVTSVEDAPVFTQTGVGSGSGSGGFVDISSTGVDTGIHCDDCATTRTLPFPITFYGTTYSGDATISSNGWMSFEPAYLGYTNGFLPTGVPMVLPWWDDLWTGGGGVYMQDSGVAPHRQLIVQWNATGLSDDNPIQFQAVFTEGSGDVVFRYADATADGGYGAGMSATVGVNKDFTTFTQYSINEPTLSDGLELVFHTGDNTVTEGQFSGQPTTNEDTPLGIDVPATDADGDVLAYTVSEPAHGSATIDGTGHVTYTPDQDYNGSDSFTVSVKDHAESTPVTKDVAVTVNAVNDAPVIDQAGPLAVSVDEDSSTGVDVAVTAADVDAGDTLTWSASDPEHGTVTGGGSTGEFTYVPDANFDGTESFTVTVTDGGEATDTIPVDVTITNPDNDAPVVSAISAQSMDEDGTLEIPFSAIDPDTGDVLDITVGSSDPTLLPTGSLALGGTGSERTITVHPADNLSGPAHLFLMVTDGQAAPHLQDILLTVNPVNDLPVADAGTLTTNEDTPGSGSLSGNDPIEGSPVTFSLSGENGGAEHGTVTITNAATGAYTYVPDANYNGADSFSFVANDGSDNSEPAAIDVTVDAVNDAPAFDGTGNSGFGNEEAAITGAVQATDVDGDPLTYTIEEGADNGTATVDGETGEWNYTGDTNFAGDDSFTITVTDGHLTDTIPVEVSVDNVNDAPVFNAGGNSGIGNEDTAIPGTVTATDPDAGDTLTYSIAEGEGAADGAASVDETTGAWSYTGNQDFNGTDGFTVTVTDADGETDTVLVNVTVNAVNDAPAFDGTGNSGSGNEEAAILGAVQATDVDGDNLAYSIEAGDGPDNGTASVNGETGAWSYTGALNYYGPDSFRITVSDGNGGSDTIVVSLSVANVNDVPVVSTIGNLSTNEDVNLHIPFSASDADPADILTITVGSSNPTLLPSGAVTVTNDGGNNRTLHIAPAANRFGTAQVFVSVSDGHAAPVIQNIALTVTSVNDLPVANAASLSTNEDTAKAGTLTGSDPVEGSPVTFSLVGANGGALHGTVSITNAATGAYTYTPNADQNGPDSFSFVANDGLNDSLPATVSVSIAPIDDVPVANDDLAGPTNEDTALVGINVLANDTGLGDGGLGITFSNEVGGTATLVGNLVTFTPTANVNGPAGFDYTVSDVDLDADTGHVTIAVVPVQDFPVITQGSGPLALSVAEDTPKAGSISATDPDTADVPLGDVLTYSVSAAPAHGSVTGLGANGSYTYTPAANFDGSDSFTLQVSDGHPGGTDAVVVNVTMIPAEDGPVIDQGNGPLALSVTEDVAKAGSISATDPDTGDTLTYSVLVDGTQGSVTGLGANGSYTYTPAANSDGTDSFTLQVSDGRPGGTDTVVVNVTMIPAQDAPAFDGSGNSGSGDEETVISGTVHAADPDTGDSVSYTIEAGGEPSSGTADVDSNGGWTYTGGLGFIGTDSFIITATDADGLTDTITVTITVTDPNLAPVIDEANSDVAPAWAMIVNGHIEASDPDGDALTYSIQGNPGWVTIDTNGDYQWDLAQGGQPTFTVVVSDGALTDTVLVTIVI